MEETCVKFNLQLVNDLFKRCLMEGEEDVNIELYLKSYEELNKFFSLMGTVFGFVSSELKSKVTVLRDTLVTYETALTANVSVKSLVAHEVEQKLLEKRGYISGSRTLLRLHRALDFIAVFLRNVADLDDEEATSTACRTAYEATLAAHHAFVVRNAARVAMYTLPNRKHLLLRTCGSAEAVQQAIDILPDTLNVIQTVFRTVERIYSDNNLLKLP